MFPVYQVPGNGTDAENGSRRAEKNDSLPDGNALPSVDRAGSGTDHISSPARKKQFHSRSAVLDQTVFFSFGP